MSETQQSNHGAAGGHSHVALRGEGAPPSPEDVARQRRATRIMMLVLIPIAVWTLVGLIIMWPGNVDEHLRGNTALTQFGVTMQSGQVLGVRDVSSSGEPGSDGLSDTRPAGEATVLIQDGPEAGQQQQIAIQPSVYSSGVQPGQEVKLYRVPIDAETPPAYQFADFQRTVPLIAVVIVFAIALIAVARKRGALALVGLAFSAFIVIKFMLPALISGSNPVWVALVGGSAILFVVLYVTHGFSVRTTTALLGTLFGMFIATMFGWLMSSWAHLTGISSEDDNLLWGSAPDMRLSGVVICAIIIASVGVLNDVTITQASAVWELAGTEEEDRRLFGRAMRIGRDHIASTVYTIAFATTGASLTAYLMLVIYNRPLLDVVGLEQFAMEIITTMVGATAVILAMPLTTAIGVAVVTATRSRTAELRPGVDGGHPEDELLDLDTRHPDWAPSTPEQRGKRLPKLPALPKIGRSAPEEPAEPKPRRGL